MALTFYTNPMSRGRIVRWMLEEIGCPYDAVLVDWADKPAALIQANPMGKVPTVVHDGTVVTEAAAICAYLADAFPDAGLAPPPTERGAYYRWLFFAASSYEYAGLMRGLGQDLDADKRGQVGYGTYALMVDTLEAGLTGRTYVAGDRFTAADLYLGAQIGWGLQFGFLERRPVFEDYDARLRERPARRRAEDIDNALVPPR